MFTLNIPARREYASPFFESNCSVALVVLSMNWFPLDEFKEKILFNISRIQNITEVVLIVITSANTVQSLPLTMDSPRIPKGNRLRQEIGPREW